MIFYISLLLLLLTPYTYKLYGTPYISFQRKEMNLAAKFELATSCQSVSIRDIVVDKKYPVVHPKRIITKFGSTTLLTLHDSDSSANLQMLLPKRYSEVISEDDIHMINNNIMSTNLIFKGFCQKNKTYMLAIV